MKVSSKGRITIAKRVREAMGIRPNQTELEFKKDDSGRWYISKTLAPDETPSRFRLAYKHARISMSTNKILALTRG